MILKRRIWKGKMLFADKNYYYLQEVMHRWGVALIDIRYFAEHGELELLTWIPDKILKVFKCKRTEDGEPVWLQTAVTNYKGYVVVEPDELRKIFHLSPHPVSKFQSMSTEDRFEIWDGGDVFTVGIDDLVVSRIEREKFEERFALPREDKESGSREIRNYASFSGRPSVMHKIEHEMQNRAQTNALCPSLAAESRYLHDWAKINIPTQQVPTARGISNALRSTYKLLSGADSSDNRTVSKDRTVSADA